MSQYFPPYRISRGGDIKFELDLSNYTAETNLKIVSHVGFISFALKTNLSSLKIEVNKLDIDKLVPVPGDLARLSDVVEKEVVKKTEYNTLVTKVNNIDITNFVKKTKYDTDIGSLNQKLKQGSGVASKNDLDAIKNKIPNVIGFLLTSVFNSKTTEVENKTPGIKN